MCSNNYDVIIIGAGISGIDAAHHLKTAAPHKTFRVLERRANPGGTWDVFGDCGASSEVLVPFLGRPWGLLGILGRLWEVLGTLWVSLDVFMGYPGCAWGMGSANQQFQFFCNLTGPAQETY